MVTITATWAIDYWTPDGDFGMAAAVELAAIEEQKEREKATFWARHKALRDARGGR
jgi:hypothetical protein